MSFTIRQSQAPLKLDDHGSVRVAHTQVLLDVVIAAFQAGASAEQIVDQYPAIDLALAYAVIAYYLQDKSEVNAYLASRRDEATRLRSDVTRNLRRRYSDDERPWVGVRR